MSDDESLGPLYRAAITATPATGHLDPAQARTAARRRQQRRRGATAGVLVASVLAALFSIVPRLDDGGNVVAVPQARPTSASAEPEPVMTVEPSSVRAGSTIKVYFPTELERGVAFELESREASGWQLEYYLVAGFGGWQPQRPWWHVDDPDQEGADVPAVAIGGPGGEQLRVPDVAEPGEYRLCTGEGSPRACTLLTIR
jgi:hypothetical protein